MNSDIVIDIKLAPIFDSDIAIPQMHNLISEHHHGIIAPVHDVNLGQAADRTDSFRVNLPHQMEGLTIGQILIRWDHAQDDGPGLLYVFQGHLFGDLVDILWLVFHGNQGYSWQINYRQIRAIC